MLNTPATMIGAVAPAFDEGRDATKAAAWNNAARRQECGRRCQTWRCRSEFDPRKAISYASDLHLGLEYGIGGIRAALPRSSDRLRPPFQSHMAVIAQPDDVTAADAVALAWSNGKSRIEGLPVAISLSSWAVLTGIVIPTFL